MGKTIGPQKKTRSLDTDRQTRVDRIMNEEAEEEIRDAMTFGDAVLTVLGLKKEEEN